MSTNKEYLIRKAKQAARRAAASRMDHLTPDVCFGLIVRQKPRLMPSLLWRLLLKIVLKLN